MVAICFKCNRDVDTLENPKAGHAENCPLWTKCFFCGDRIIKTEDGKSFKIKNRVFSKSMATSWEDIDFCISCNYKIKQLQTS